MDGGLEPATACDIFLLPVLHPLPVLLYCRALLRGAHTISFPSRRRQLTLGATGLHAPSLPRSTTCVMVLGIGWEIQAKMKVLGGRR